MNRRYYELDTIRGLAILGVILIHISGEMFADFEDYGEFVALIVNQLSRVAVPAFLILSGLGLTLGNKLEYGYRHFLKQQLQKIVPLYILWNFIYYFARIILSGGTFNFWDFIQNTILGNNFFHLYYVPLIILLYIAYPLLLKIGKSTVGFVFSFAISIISQLADIFTGNPVFNESLNIFNWVTFFVFGIWLSVGLRMKIEKIKQHRLLCTSLFSISAVMVVLESFFLLNSIDTSLATTSMRPSIIIFSFLFVLFIMSLEWQNKFWGTLSKWSYGIYLSHALIWRAYALVYGIFFHSEGVFYIITSTIFVTVLSLVVTLILNKAMVFVNRPVRKLNS